MLKQLLPQPINLVKDFDDEDKIDTKKSITPPYGQRQNWRPQSDADFSDGGAFPEIHVVQYPLGMGKPQSIKTVSNALVKQLDIHGNVQYEALARQHHSKGRHVHAKITDLIPQEISTENDPALARPGKDEEDETAERTRLALMGFAGEKHGSAKPIKEIQKRTEAQC